MTQADPVRRSALSDVPEQGCQCRSHGTLLVVADADDVWLAAWTPARLSDEAAGFDQRRSGWPDRNKGSVQTAMIGNHIRQEVAETEATGYGACAGANPTTLQIGSPDIGVTLLVSIDSRPAVCM